jgi:hypothetical protein
LDYKVYQLRSWVSLSFNSATPKSLTSAYFPFLVIGKIKPIVAIGSLCIMPTASGFEQAYNVQASVDIATMLTVGQQVSQNPNDKQEVTRH